MIKKIEFSVKKSWFTGTTDEKTVLSDIEEMLSERKEIIDYKIIKDSDFTYIINDEGITSPDKIMVIKVRYEDDGMSEAYLDEYENNVGMEIYRLVWMI